MVIAALDWKDRASCLNNTFYFIFVCAEKHNAIANEWRQFPVFCVQVHVGQLDTMGR